MNRNTKRFCCLWALIYLLGVSIAFGGLKIPRNVYRMDQLDAAVTEAKSKNKPLTFVYTEENTNWGLCTSASLDAIQKLKQESILIYAAAGKEWKTLPRLVQEAVHSPEAGKFIPITVVVDADLKKIIAIVPYNGDAAKRNKLLRDAEKKISEESKKAASGT